LLVAARGVQAGRGNQRLKSKMQNYSANPLGADKIQNCLFRKNEVKVAEEGYFNNRKINCGGEKNR
jgi:hypothetical protein